MEAEYNKLSTEKSSYKILVAQYNRICNAPNVTNPEPTISNSTDHNNPDGDNIVPDLMIIDPLPTEANLNFNQNINGN